MWWFYYDKNSTITVVSLYLPFKNVNKIIAWKVYIFKTKNKKTWKQKIISHIFYYSICSINLPCEM